MKKTCLILILVVSITAILAACGGGAQEAPSTGQEADVPASQSDEPGSPPTEAPALQPIDLGGPEIGTFIVWVDSSILVPVPGGDFVMGDGGDDDPEHTVGLSSFWIYRTKVTNRMYSICVAAGICSPPIEPQSLQDFQNLEKRDLPVSGVNWEQADAYCKFVEGRLPTEAEWEKTARGPEGNPYPWGEAAPGCNLLNFAECLGAKSDVFEYPQGKSYYDALDMAGNAFEWVADWYNPQYYGIAPAIDPLGPETGEVRSVRSSSFISLDNDVPSARRFFLKPDITRIDLGFRCVVEDPRQFAPYCEVIYVPGQPGAQAPQEPPGQSSCPPPVLTPGGTGCQDQNSLTGWGSASASGDVTSVYSNSLNCSESGGVVTCTGPENIVGEVIACNECDDSITSLTVPAGAPHCPPGMYFDGKICIGDGEPGRCPKGYTYRIDTQCCEAGPGIPYPGCGPDEYYNGQICVPGQKPKEGSCTSILVGVGNCGGDNPDGGDTPPTGICPPGQTYFCPQTAPGPCFCR